MRTPKQVTAVLEAAEAWVDAFYGDDLKEEETLVNAVNEYRQYRDEMRLRDEANTPDSGFHQS